MEESCDLGVCFSPHCLGAWAWWLPSGWPRHLEDDRRPKLLFFTPSPGAGGWRRKEAVSGTPESRAGPGRLHRTRRGLRGEATSTPAQRGSVLQHRPPCSCLNRGHSWATTRRPPETATGGLQFISPAKLINPGLECRPLPPRLLRHSRPGVTATVTFQVTAA